MRSQDQSLLLIILADICRASGTCIAGKRYGYTLVINMVQPTTDSPDQKAMISPDTNTDAAAPPLAPPAPTPASTEAASAARTTTDAEATTAAAAEASTTTTDIKTDTNTEVAEAATKSAVTADEGGTPTAHAEAKRIVWDYCCK